MANPNKLIRQPILNIDGPSTSTASKQFSEEDIIQLISKVTIDVLNQHGPQLIQNTLNPNSVSNNATDQTIDERFLNNLKELDKIPDVVKCIREFSGKEGEFNSWKKSVERILSIYENEKGTPKYYGILNVIRNKIVGNADIALESYNTPLDWTSICRCLALHYADKRDIATLEYQMTSLIQGRNSIEEFYQEVYTHLSLILNKIGYMGVGGEAINLLTKTFRDKALDTFIRGLNGDLPKLLGIKEPVDLPQALHLCLKLENQKYRTNYAHNSNVNVQRTNNNNSRYNNQQNFNKRFNHNNINKFYPELSHAPRPQQTPFLRNNNYNSERMNPPPRPFAPKPQPKPEPMEVDQTMHSRRIDYVNRPQNNRFFNNKRAPQSISNKNFIPNKTQRNFHIEENLLVEKDDIENGEEIQNQMNDIDDVHFLD